MRSCSFEKIACRLGNVVIYYHSNDIIIFYACYRATHDLAYPHITLIQNYKYYIKPLASWCHMPQIHEPLTIKLKWMYTFIFKSMFEKLLISHCRNLIYLYVYVCHLLTNTVIIHILWSLRYIRL